MNQIAQKVQPGGQFKGNFNKILAFVGLGWFSSMLLFRYVIKPMRNESRMKETESMMNNLFEEQMKQKLNKNEDTDIF